MTSIKQYQFKHILQSSWLGNLMNQYLPDIGFFVEIGMGHTTTNSSRQAGLVDAELNCSNTAELIDLGWDGIYIEPIKEFCDEAHILHKNNLSHVQILNIAASDVNGECIAYGMETLIPNGILKYYDDVVGKYYDYPGRRIITKRTSEILTDSNCPSIIDFMSIDVEGYEDKVLRGLDFSLHLPKMLFIETTRVGVQEIEGIIPKDFRMIYTDGFNTCWIKL